MFVRPIGDVALDVALDGGPPWPATRTTPVEVPDEIGRSLVASGGLFEKVPAAEARRLLGASTTTEADAAAGEATTSEEDPDGSA